MKRIGYACRVFFRGRTIDGSGWYLSQDDEPHHGQPLFGSRGQASLALFHMTEHARGRGMVILESQAHEIAVDESGLVLEINTFTFFNFDGGSLIERGASEMNGVPVEIPSWENKREARLSLPFDDDRPNIYGDTVCVKVGEKMPQISQPETIFGRAA